jgi:hypothetical protein
VLLIISVCATIVACILMALEMNSYEWSVNPKVSQAKPAGMAPTFAAVARLVPQPRSPANLS